MEAISKTIIDTSKFRVPTHIKRVLRKGGLGTYDVLELMGNAINANMDGMCVVAEILEELNSEIEALKDANTPKPIDIQYINSLA